MAKFNLTPEQLEAATSAKSPEELIEIAKGYGIAITAGQAQAFLYPPVGEISDEELANVTGGNCSDEKPVCPKCGSQDIVVNVLGIIDGVYHSEVVCTTCSAHERIGVRLWA